jgi:hypothetical protein
LLFIAKTDIGGYGDIQYGCPDGKYLTSASLPTVPVKLNTLLIFLVVELTMSLLSTGSA